MKLGAGRALGVDTDPIAISATERNAALNHVTRRVRARRGSIPSNEPPFDLVVANLIASVLISLAPALHAELAPGGALLASGIFEDRESAVRDAFETAGLEVIRAAREGEWVLLEAVRPAGSRQAREAGAERAVDTIAGPCNSCP